MTRAAAALGLLGLAVVAAAAPRANAGAPRREELPTGDDAPLVVYTLEGAAPGPRVLVVGGIHGDEPGGTLAADALVDALDVTAGTVILVPRANFHSIVRQERGARGDMNRRFAASGDSGDGPDARVVDLLKARFGTVDAFLNLHDGSGFYAPEAVDAMRNPRRFGQSIVIDARSFEGPAGPIPLGEIADRAVERVNRGIEDAAHRFHVNDTKTGDPASLHPELRASATYYALKRYGIPAFGVETSKDLPSIETRVRHQFLAATALLEELGVRLRVPPLRVEPTALDFAIVRRNGGETSVLVPGSSLRLASGDLLEVLDARATRPRGITADVEGAGGWNDLGRKVEVRRSTQIVFRRDGEEIARIPVTVSAEPASARTPAAGAAGSAASSFAAFAARVNGGAVEVPRDGILEVAAGDRVAFAVPGAGIGIHVHGFPGGTARDPRDDAGFEVDTGRDLLPGLSVDGAGEYYRVDAVAAGDRVLATAFLRVRPIRVAAIALEVNGEKRRVEPAAVLDVRPGDRLTIRDVEADTNAGDLRVNLKGYSGGADGEDRGRTVRVAEDLDPRWALDPRRTLYEIVVSRGEAAVARFYLRVSS